MALSPSPDNSVLTNEVNEAVRRERMEYLWKHYGRWILSAIIAALLVYSGFLFWQNQREQAKGAEAEILIAAVTKLASNPPRDTAGNREITEQATGDKQDEALADLERLTEKGGNAYRLAATLQLANAKLTNGDRKAAAVLLGDLANDAAVDKPMRDLALIRQTMIAFDTLKPETVIARMQPIINQKNPASAWFSSAAELAAIAYLARGETDRAGSLYARILRNRDVPQSLQLRAAQMADVLGVATEKDEMPSTDDTKKTGKNGVSKDNDDDKLPTGAKDKSE